MTSIPLTPRTRSTLGELVAYKPDRSPVAIDLSDNTNRWGPPPSAVRELGRIVGASSRYPEGYSEPLREVLAEYARVEPSSIIVGAGSDNVLDAAIRAFGDPGDVLSYAQPSFQMVPAFARMNALRVASVPFTAVGDVDAEALLAGDPAIVYVCSPNNPTGMRIPRATLELVVARARGLVVVDEAYFEFSGESIVDLVASSSCLLVVRTLSKAWGLAGLRVGYGIAQPAVIREIEKSRGPYTVSLPSERAAAAAVVDDRAWMRRTAALAIENREWLSAAMRERGFDPLPSAANFILVPLREAQSAAAAMRTAGVAVRAFEGLDVPHEAIRHAGGRALRISVGPREELDTLIAALDAWSATCA